MERCVFIVKLQSQLILPFSFIQRLKCTGIIRASVDAVCRDGEDEKLRHCGRKNLLTRPESFAKPSKHTSNNLWTHFQPYITPARSYLPSGLHARIRQHGISRISVIIFISFFFGNFFTKHLQSRRRCARSPSDRFFLASHLYATIVELAW